VKPILLTGGAGFIGSNFILNGWRPNEPPSSISLQMASRTRNGFTMRTPSISRCCCRFSEKSTLQPACLAARTTKASQKENP